MSGIIGDNTGRGTGLIKAAGGGDWIRLNTTTVSGSPSTISIDSVFSSTYKIYRLFFNDVNYSTGAYQDLQFLVSGTAQTSADYEWKCVHLYGDFAASTSSDGTKNTGSGFRYTQGYLQSQADYPESGNITFYNPNDSTAYNAMTSVATCYDGSHWRVIWGAGFYNGGKIAATGIKMTLSSGNVSTGEYVMYGLKRA